MTGPPEWRDPLPHIHQGWGCFKYRKSGHQHFVNLEIRQNVSKPTYYHTVTILYHYLILIVTFESYIVVSSQYKSGVAFLRVCQIFPEVRVSSINSRQLITRWQQINIVKTIQDYPKLRTCTDCTDSLMALLVSQCLWEKNMISNFKPIPRRMTQGALIDRLATAIFLRWHSPKIPLQICHRTHNQPRSISNKWPGSKKPLWPASNTALL